MFTEFSPGLETLLVIISFLSGIGITAIGPGGIFLTIALFSLTALTPAQVAGTASATFIAAGVLGTVVYARSGELKDESTIRLAMILSVTAIAGALLGAWLNPRVSEGPFGALLGVVVLGVGGVMVYQGIRGLEPRFTVSADTPGGRALLAALGFTIGVAGGLLGVGGPVLAVPALIVVGVPMLFAVAAAQAQSVLLSGFATLGYLAQGAVVWPLAFLLVVPLLAGAVVGWRIAHRIDPRRLRIALGLVLLGVGPYLAFA